MYVFYPGWGLVLSGDRIWFGLYQSCRNRGNVGHASVFGLQFVWVVLWSEFGLGQGLGGWGLVMSV